MIRGLRFGNRLFPNQRPRSVSEWGLIRRIYEVMMLNGAGAGIYMRVDAVLGFIVALVAICGVAKAQSAEQSPQQSQTTPIAPNKSPRLIDLISDETLQPTADEIAIDRKLNICHHCLEVVRPLRENFDHCRKRRESLRYLRECG
jgi:hypothetical protein